MCVAYLQPLTSVYHLVPTTLDLFTPINAKMCVQLIKWSLDEKKKGGPSNAISDQLELSAMSIYYYHQHYCNALKCYISLCLRFHKCPSLHYFLLDIHLDECDAKPCKTEQQLCFDITGECTCRKGLTLDVNGRCVGEQTLIICRMR